VIDSLTPDELASFIGTSRKADQIEWLRANRIPFLADKKGRAKVLRATVAAMLGAPGNSSGPELRFASK
jgi:hypothetical protein